MKKHGSEEAFYNRLKKLADVNKTQIKENFRILGTLIDYKRASDGIAYGIVKENHHYYIKKAGTKKDPDVSDFAYIGGLSNITEYQYNKLSDADKNRNMIFNIINEATSSKVSKTGSKKRLNEDKAGQEIDMAASKIGDLDAATAAEPSGEPTTSDLAGLSAEPTTDVEAGGETPTPEISTGNTPEAGGETPEAGGETPDSETGAEDTPETDGETPETDDNKDITTKELEKSLGKITNTIRKTDLEPVQVKSYLNSFISSFKDKLQDVEIEDRKEIANKLLKIVGQEDIEDLGDSIPQDKPESGIEEEQCAECGGFGKYAESRGYSTPESFMECDDEEKSNVISGYANAHGEGMNDGDFKTIAIVITPEILEKLKGDYGHEEYAEKLTPYTDSLNETSEEDKMAQLNEFWGGLGNLGKKAAQGVGTGLKSAGQAIGGVAQAGAQKVAGAVKAGAQKVATGAQNAVAGVQKAGQEIKKAYNAGEINPEVKKLEGVAANLGKQIAALNKRMVGAGQQPVNVKSILATIQNQLGGAAGTADLSKYRMGESGMVDAGNVEVQPNMLKEEDEPEKPETDDIETPETPETNDIETSEPEETSTNFFAPDSQSLGIATVKPDGAPTSNVDVNVDAQNKTVNVTMNEAKRKLIKQIAESVNAYMLETTQPKVSSKTIKPKTGEIMSESEQKIRKYIRNRLEEKSGLRKSTLNENKKSDKLKKLDTLIDEQFKLFESVVLKKKKVIKK